MPRKKNYKEKIDDFIVSGYDTSTIKKLIYREYGISLKKSSINSILNKTYKNIELIIYNDGSYDSTQKIISSIDSPLIKIFSNNKNIGLTKALNFLISKSSGEIIARQDSDDISYLDRIEKQVDYLISNKLDAAASRARRKKF